MTASGRNLPGNRPLEGVAAGRLPGNFPDQVHAFVGAVRLGGVAVSTDRVELFFRALAALGPEHISWAGRATLCTSRDDVIRYDSLFSGHQNLLRVPGKAAPPKRLVAPFTFEGEEPAAQGALAAQASATELLRHRDYAQLSDVERREAARLLALLAPAAPMRRVRRMRPAPAGMVDTRRTMRDMLRGLGEPARLRRRARAQRPRRLVFLLDISGSMTPYADALLRLAHAAVQARPGSTEAFTIGTRLTRVTPCLRQRDPDAALAAAGAEVPDWRGGTRLGEALHRYLKIYGHRGMARAAVAVICSDGWECGDPERLRDAMAWLARLAGRIIWVTPHAGRQGFAPSASGLVAALPYVDHLVAGHSVAALGELVTVLKGRR